MDSRTAPNCFVLFYDHNQLEAQITFDGVIPNCADQQAV
jgi:hypothetical protein